MKPNLIEQADQDSYLDGLDGDRIYINTTASWTIQQRGWLCIMLYMSAVN
jgi:hypothetical protein